MLFLVDLPKPIHGMSTINSAMLARVKAERAGTRTINTVPSWAARYFDSSFWTPLKLLHSAFCIVRFFVYALLNPRTKVYRSVNGGIGQLFDIFYFSISRCFGIKLYIHHHSFSYLNRRSKLFELLVRIAGRKAVHICLGSTMAARLTEHYGVRSDQIRVVSNLAFFTAHEPHQSESKGRPLVIGHLANLTFEKGLDTFLQLCDQLDAAGVPYSALLAGPASTPEAEQAIASAQKEKNGRLIYLGPVYGDEKTLFFSKLDAFVFPSRYVNEAEPLVLYEAAMHGALVAGTRRGCMGDIISQYQGLSVDENENASAALYDGLVAGMRDGAFKPEAREQRKRLFEYAQKEASSQLEELIRELA